MTERPAFDRAGGSENVFSVIVRTRRVFIPKMVYSTEDTSSVVSFIFIGVKRFFFFRLKLAFTRVFLS